MKIQKIELFPINIPLNEPFVISKGALTHATNTIVKIWTDDGLYGLGECCPFRSIHGETQAGTIAAGKNIAELFIGQDAREIHSLVALMDKGLAGNASIKAAFDMALYDLNSKALGLPLYRYLHGDNKKTIFTDMTVSLLPLEQMVEKAIKFQNKGFPILKIKLGDRPAQNDIDRMVAIRESVGDDLPLRIDANQGWNYLEAMRALDAMYELDIEHCEAPIEAGNFIDLKRLSNESPIAIMGDESVFSHQDAYRMLAHGCVDLINIKLGKSGGIANAMKIAGIAEAANVYCQVGSFSESRLGITALTHFAKAWDNIIYYDLDSPLMHSIDPIEGGMVYSKDWQVTVTEEPGIGCDIDPAFLKKFEVFAIS